MITASWPCWQRSRGRAGGSEVLVYAWLMPASTVLQAVIGGITANHRAAVVDVTVHLLVSMAMVWLATVLYVKIGQPDDGIHRAGAKPLRTDLI